MSTQKGIIPREVVERMQRENTKCPNCGGDISKGGHFVPPSLGEEGFYICEKKEI